MAHTIYTVHHLIELSKSGMSVKVASFMWKHCKPCRISLSMSKQICVECQHSQTVLEICTQCSDESLKRSVWVCYCSIDDALIKFIPRGNEAHWCTGTPFQWSHFSVVPLITFFFNFMFTFAFLYDHCVKHDWCHHYKAPVWVDGRQLSFCI